MERLYELHTSGEYDVIVLDTPPSRNALDFLEAPGTADALRRRAERCGSSSGRGCVPGGWASRRSSGSPASRFLRDLSELAAGFEGMYDGFARRASEVSALLASDRTTFLLVTVPQVEPLAEADFFWRALRERELPFGGMIVNKVHPSYVGGAPAARTRLQGEGQARTPRRRGARPDRRTRRAEPRPLPGARRPRPREHRRASSAGSDPGRSSRCRCSTTTSTTSRALRPWGGTCSIRPAGSARGRPACRRASTTSPGCRPSRRASRRRRRPTRRRGPASGPPGARRASDAARPGWAAGRGTSARRTFARTSVM